MTKCKPALALGLDGRNARECCKAVALARRNFRLESSK